jgi:eukaryotic-like serine/threonine-protein kinase
VPPGTYDDAEGPTREPGMRMGAYRLGELIGAGTMADVFEAVDVRTGASAAVKVLRPELAELSEVVARFVREGRTLQKLENPNIVRVFEHGVTEAGDPWMAMERLRGGSLQALIKAEGRLDPERALRLAGHVANALVAVHAHGVVHRDIKPENIFIVDPDSPRELAKLIDFGVARVHPGEMGMHSVPYTRVGDMLGTAAFVAPEQATGGEVGPQADVFSLAVTLYEMMTGKLPFEGDDIQRQLAARLEGRLVPIEKRLGRRQVPPALADLLERALARTPERRPADGLAMLREIEGIRATTSNPRIDVQSDVVRPSGPGAADARASIPDSPYGAGADGFSLKRPRRRMVLPVLVAIAFMALLGGGGFVLLRALHAFDP